ncbi:thymidine kinase [Vibrio owensii]|uniref:thymidine kinase n=1 Tax=Vibrio owensii TaxID=696485 RepID=UPI003CC67BD4
MSSLYFHYSAMNAGKSTLLLQSSHNYQERGMKTILLSPSIDDRDGEGVIASRIGLSAKAIGISTDEDLLDLIGLIKEETINGGGNKIGAVFVDEAQFLTEEQVDQLSDVVDKLNLPVLCYGLRTDSFGELFPGSKRLLAIADKLVEQKTICECGKKANFVVRQDEHGNAVKNGSQVAIGGNDKYVSYCRKHWKEKMGK